MQCHVTPYHAMPCHAMLCNAMTCHATPYNAMQCHVKPYHASLCNATPHNPMRCHAMQCNATPRHVDTIHHSTIEMSQNMSNCTQNWKNNWATICNHTIVSICRKICHIATKIGNDHSFHIPSLCSRVTGFPKIQAPFHYHWTNQLRNMSHWSLNCQMILDTIHHQTINCLEIGHIAGWIATWS